MAGVRGLPPKSSGATTEEEKPPQRQSETVVFAMLSGRRTTRERRFARTQAQWHRRVLGPGRDSTDASYWVGTIAWTREGEQSDVVTSDGGAMRGGEESAVKWKA